MPLYDGRIAVEDGDIGVIVAIEGERVRLSAGGSEIGEWDVDDCEIEHVEANVFSITAEEESLQFVPNQPALFARAVAVETPRSEPANEAGGRLLQHQGEPTKAPWSKTLAWAMGIAGGAAAIWAVITLL